MTEAAYEPASAPAEPAPPPAGRPYPFEPSAMVAPVRSAGLRIGIAVAVAIGCLGFMVLAVFVVTMSLMAQSGSNK